MTNIHWPHRLVACASIVLLASTLVTASSTADGPRSASAQTVHKSGKKTLERAKAIARKVRREGRRTLRNATHVPGVVEVSIPPPPPTLATPAYANFFFRFLPNDGETAGLTFFRDPTCVRPDFNLLEWIDPPAAFSCPLEPDFGGYTLRENLTGPPWGVEVHWRPTIYFVDYEELLDAASDGLLTIGEIEALPSLRIGDTRRADYYVVNSFAPPSFGDGDGHEWFAAEGTMRDGGRFIFAYEEAHVFPEDIHVFLSSVVHMSGGGKDDR